MRFNYWVEKIVSVLMCVLLAEAVVLLALAAKKVLEYGASC